MVDETREYVRVNHGSSFLETLDERMTRLNEVGFIGQLKLPANVWESGVSVQANEYRGVMQVSATDCT